MGMIKVLFISHCAHIGGAERVLISFLAQVKQFYPLVLVPPGELADALEQHGIEVLSSRALGRLNKESNPLWPLLLATRFIFSQLEIVYHILKRRPHIVQANSFYAFLYIVIAAKLTGRKTVWHMHDIFTGRFLFLLKMYGRLADHIIAVSEAVKESLATLQISPLKITTTYNSLLVREKIDQEDSTIIEYLFNLKKKFGLIVGTMGTLEERKGFLECLQAVRSCPDAAIVIAGEPFEPSHHQYKEKLLKYIVSNKMEERVVFLGNIKDIQAFFNNIDVFVHYPTQADPLPTVILEATQERCPVIVADIGGCAECIGNGKWGTLVPANQPDELAKVLQGRDFNQIAAIEYQNFQQLFSNQLKENKHLNIYQKLLRENSSRP
jgi:glycosyltransferase involved in cell wall biosynthesis